MFAVGMLGSYITQGVYTVSGPFHPFGGAVDIIVVEQDDGTFKSSPWNVKFGKFQGVLKTREKIVGISVNDVPMDFHMYLDHKGEAYFEKEVEFGEDMVLSPLSATSSGDETSEFGRMKILTDSQIVKSEEGKTQQTPNIGTDMKPSGTSNDGDNLNSEMPDHVERVDSNSTVWISDALVDQDRNEVVIAISENNSYLIEGKLGSVNGSQTILKKEEHIPERLENSVSIPSNSVFGLVFGGKSQHLLGGSSSPAYEGNQIAAVDLKSRFSREGAEIVVDLLDKRWRTGGKEILLTSTNKVQTVATAQHLLGGSSSPAYERNQIAAVDSKSRFSREGAEIVVDLLDKRWRTGGKEILLTSTNKVQTVATATSLDAEIEEIRSSMHDSEASTSVRNETSSWKSETQEIPGTMVLAEDLEQAMLDEATSENTCRDDLQVSTLTLETSANNGANSVENVPQEDWFLRSAAEEQTLVLLFQGRLGEGAPPNDFSSNSIYKVGDQKGKCNAGQAAVGEMSPLGVLGEDLNQNMKCGPIPEVVLMSVDGHIITAPVNVENSRSSHLGQYFDISKSSSSGNSGIQVAISSIANCELIETEKQSRSEQFAFIPCTSTISMPVVSVNPGTNEPSKTTTEFVRNEEVDALSSEGKIIKCRDIKPASDPETSESITCKKAKVVSLEMTPDIISREKIELCRDRALQDTQFKAEHFGLNDMHASNITITPNYTTGESDTTLMCEPCLHLGTSATHARCVLEDGIFGTEDLHASRDMELQNKDSGSSHNWVPLHPQSNSKKLPEIHWPSQSARLSPRVIESPSQQGYERFYSFREGSFVDLVAENSEEDLFKSCLALEDLPNLARNEALEVCDSGFEVVCAGKSLLSSDSVDSAVCKEPSVKANSRNFKRIRSKPIVIPDGENEKGLDLISSASLPARFYEAGRSNKGHFYGHSVGSGFLSNISRSHSEADATGFWGQDLNFVDRQNIDTVINGSQNDSAEFVEVQDAGKSSSVDVDLSLCRHLLSEGMGAEAAATAFESQKVSYEAFQHSGSVIIADERLVVKIGGRYFPWVEAAPCIVGMVAFGSEVAHKLDGGIAVEAGGSTKDAESQTVATIPSTRWNLWPFSFGRSSVEKGPRSISPASKQALSATTNIVSKSPTRESLQKNGYYESPQKSKERSYVPTSAQLASLKLKDGPNKVTFTFSTRVLGKTQVDARIYLWKWNTRIVISDVDGTITKSDVLGQVMPLVGRDWSQSGVTRLFSAIKDNGYELLFLSARAISQAYLTRQFLLNLKQDGETLPDGPVFISPDGLIPSLYREVIRRAPHEFKISCLEGIRELFPSDVNPFYAGFGNRNTDEISYLKVGIPKGKIFIINPKGEVIVNHRVEDVKSYTSFHTLVDDMFPPMSSHEQEDFNSWNYWKLPLPDIEELNKT